MLENFFKWPDYLAVIATLGFSLGIGVYFAFASKQTREDVLLGGKSMGAFPVAASMLVTYLSAITILGYPAEIYSHGIQIFLMVFVSMVCIPVSLYLFVSVFYKLRYTSIYEYLEQRFESVTVRWLASFTFIIQILIINGVVLYAPSIALEAIVGLPVWVSILGIGLCGTIYTSIGGLKAVLWTDVFQLFMILMGMFFIVIKGFAGSGGLAKSFALAHESGRLQLFDFTVDPFMRHNTVNFFLGYGTAIVTLYGTHQPQVQRYCSLPSMKHVVKAITLAVLLKIFTMSLVLLTGIAIYATYAGCDPVLLGHIKKADAIVPYFVIKELGFVPAMLGIFVSCIFSAVLSSVSSTLNSLAAVTWEDFFYKINYFKTMSEKNQAISTRLISVGYGGISILLAIMAQNMGALFTATMKAVGATAGPLGGIFLIGLFLPIVDKKGAIVGMITGLLSMLFVWYRSYVLTQTYKFFSPLPNDLSNCPADMDLSYAVGNNTAHPIDELDWPDKFFTVSYILYSFIGIVITVTTAVLVSMICSLFCEMRPVPKKYLHPLLHGFKSCNVEEDDYDFESVTTFPKGVRSVDEADKHPNYKYRPVNQTGIASKDVEKSLYDN